MYKEEFLNYLQNERNFSQNTIRSYFNDLNQFFYFLEKDAVSVKSVSSKHIRSWIVHSKDMGLESSTINRKISCLRSYFKFLMREEIVNKNPIHNINLLSIKKRLPVFVSEESMYNLFSKVNFSNDFLGQRDKLILDLFYQTGIRLSELVNIKINDLDVQKKILRIFGKGGKERLIPVLDQIIVCYKEYMFFREKIPSKFLFVTSKGKKAYPKMVYRIVNKYLGYISTVTKKSPHILRHTFATHLLNRGADINTIKELLGHKTLSSTQVYTHNSLEKIKRIYKKSHPRGS
tara:strand:+ start:142 stop:1011 length:870 start_codon:yes stop_codon:yes gene_type:complete